MMGAIQTGARRNLEAVAPPPGDILVPGHDIPMVQKDGRPEYPGAQEATVTAWFDDDQETMETMTSFDLTVA
jgi:hypothetical protein